MVSGLVSYKNFPHPFPCIFYRTNFDITNGTFCHPNRSLYRGLTVIGKAKKIEPILIKYLYITYVSIP